MHPSPERGGRAPAGPGLVAFALLATLRLSAALPDFDFTTARGGIDWEATHDTGPLITGTAGLTIPITGPDPFITSPSLSLVSASDLMLEMRIRSDAGGPAQLFWFKDGAREEASLHFQVRTNAWTDVCLPLPAMGDGWRLRLDPPGTNGTAQVAWLRVSPVGSRGISAVRARDNSIEIITAGPVASVALHEILPHQTLSDATTDGRLQELQSRDSRMVAVARMAGADASARDRLTSGFVATEPHPVFGRRPVGPVRHVEEFIRVSSLPTRPVKAGGKKGLQVQMVDDALELGIHHAALNVTLPSLMAAPGAPDPLVWVSNGRRFLFNRAAVDGIPVKPLSDRGVSVSLILLAYASGRADLDAVWLHPGYDRRAPNRLGEFNTVTPEGAAHFAAAIEMLADRFSQPDARNGRVSHFIVGNEVTAHWHWANMGEVPAGVFIEDYLRCVRLAHASTRKVTEAIRVCLSLDHHWNLVYGNQPLRAIAGRRLLDDFNRMARLGGNFDWHLAYHPYPENLFNPRVWQDKTALPAPESPRITFRNLGVLTAYLRRPEYLERGQARRILLSEQGFHSDGTPEGEQLQAAAYAYAWHKVDALDGIDAFILHRHVDHRDEGGLNLGLWRRKPSSVADPLSKKPIYDVFKAADTPGRDDAFRFALPLIGIGDWNEVRGR